jgi:cytochrome c oxidase cbb3-type subunit 3
VAVALNQSGFLGRVNSEFLFLTLAMGRANTAMPAWPTLKKQELIDLVIFIQNWGSGSSSLSRVVLPEADLEEGALKYHFLCSRCHGEFGEGETGPAIINEDFLEVASDAYLYETIARGREHTAMFGWATDVYNKEQLLLPDISNIIGFMRTSALAPLEYVYAGRNPGERDLGAELFSKHCAACHGEKGEGVKGPALNNQEFLSAASNGFLLATITLGREGSDMPSWGYGQEKYPQLSGKERQDLVAYLRSLQRIRIKY